MELYRGRWFKVVLPKHAHVTRKDGGHLIIRPNKKVKDRVDLTFEQGHELMELSMIFGEAMIKGLRKRGIKIKRINYQDNGNWGAAEGKPHLHLHLYGRATDSIFQKWGEALFFPPKKDPIYKKNEKLNKTDVKEIMKQAKKIMIKRGVN